MIPPENRSVKEFVDEYGIHEQTLYKWRKEAKSKGIVYQYNGTSRQKYSREMQLQIIIILPHFSLAIRNNSVCNYKR